MSMKTLKNGATVIEQVGDTVLAKIDGNYVTWKVDDDGNTHGGRYFGGDLMEAVKDLQGRTEQPTPKEYTLEQQEIIEKCLNLAWEAYDETDTWGGAFEGDWDAYDNMEENRISLIMAELRA